MGVETGVWGKSHLNPHHRKLSMLRIIFTFRPPPNDEAERLWDDRFQLREQTSGFRRI
jgi:hypothetical protein